MSRPRNFRVLNGGTGSLECGEGFSRFFNRHRRINLAVKDPGWGLPQLTSERGESLTAICRHDWVRGLPELG